MRKGALVGTILLAASLLAWGQARVLIVDQTQTIDESMRLEGLARLLLAGGTQVKASLGWPGGAPEERYEVVLVVPKERPVIWFCVPTLNEVPTPLRPFLSQLRSAVSRVYGGMRALKAPEDDPLAYLLSWILLYTGLFGGQVHD